MGNILFYKEVVEQVLLTLKDSDTLIKGMIENNEISKLRAFCVDALGLSGTIGAVRYVTLLNEILVTIQAKETLDNKDVPLLKEEEMYLHQFISSYKREWLTLEKELEDYLQG